MPTGGNPDGGGGGGGGIDEFGKAFGGNPAGGGGSVGIPANPWGSGGLEGRGGNGDAWTGQKMSYAQLVIKIP
jgi:hypothetical protein